MNRIVLAPTVVALTFFTTCANANIDQLKGLLGGKKAESTVTSSSLTEMATSAASNIDLASLVSSVAGNLNVSENQSEGGIASIMNYVQGNLSGADYAQLASSIPGIDSLLEDVPSLSGNSAASSSSSLSGLLNKASEYSSTLKSVNDLKQQFEALGLSTDMIASFVTQISSYLNVNADEETQALFKSGLDNLLTAL
ncbi:conserved exported hypothetical protein [Alteromonas macleodii]|jgi:hypothetical protein|uniref:DUF2780 domain-containing protein n=1 Tax=Alteromonas macleodii (strain English Channel 673) TaxID=1004788 RepID=A0AB33A197_ALTME|nr:DUF2780 domain-containing protein [Alteromonas macleodii]RUM32287.1 MAG: DUF2780 domain-containing protein [Alteromonas sp.]AFT75451.1 hypothetical protein AMEC673_13825 [Alteromonas macleodii str. 'English Channel 673']MBL3811281.1 DUF2780 domain-containing protein [Alteromonas macleodii]MBL3884819.1 DUF2780 domain-containing protein [Alteromonas macleodii]MDP6879507.1 DUF2780 domain-containing protein [Alteromonas macleodii]|tara:strand:- start:405 stop:995 length:591 start_codon:yes stop_codon:yes gene_type:complete